MICDHCHRRRRNVSPIVTSRGQFCPDSLCAVEAIDAAQNKPCPVCYQFRAPGHQCDGPPVRTRVTKIARVQETTPPQRSLFNDD